MLMGMRTKGRMNIRNGESFLIRIRMVMRIDNEYPQDSGSLLYPSVTFCTKYIWQSFPGVRRFFKGRRVFKGFPWVRRFFKGKESFQGVWEDALPEIRYCNTYCKSHKLESVGILFMPAISIGAGAAEQEQIAGLSGLEGVCSGGLLEQR